MAGEIPTRLTTLIGREAELDEISERLGGARVMTLTGPGGAGKTTLAQETAARLGDAFGGAVHWVELGTLTDGEEIEAAVARALDVQPLPGVTALEAAVEQLGTGRALIVLDNCEHLVADCARVAERLAAAAPGVVVLATSRVPLEVVGEIDWRVPPLSLPEENGAARSDAVELFVERASRVDRGFRLDDSNRGAVAQICRHLDGMPLAIELAAGRMRALTPDQVASDLDRALSVLAGSSRGTVPRHRTLRASIEWSYGLLDPDRQRMLHRLSVFAGGFRLATAEEVCGAEPFAPGAALGLIEDLLGHSLLVPYPGSGGDRRYRLLETVRQFALERLADSGEETTLRDRHLDAFKQLSETHLVLALTARLTEAMELLDDEAPNLLAAIDHGLRNDPNVAQRICQATMVWFGIRGHLDDALASFDRALAAGASDPVQYNRLRAAYANIILFKGRADESAAIGTETLAVAEEQEDPEGLGLSHLVLANVAVFSDPPSAAKPLARLRAFGEATGLISLTARAIMLKSTLDWFMVSAGRCSIEPNELEAVRRSGDQELLALTHLQIAGGLWTTLEVEGAREQCALSLDAAAISGARTDGLATRGMLAELDLVEGRVEAALQGIDEVRAGVRRHGGIYFLPWAELIHGHAVAMAGDLARAQAELEDVLGGAYGFASVQLDYARMYLMEVLRLLGDDEGARKAAKEAQAYFPEALGQVYARITLGRIAARSGEPVQAAELVHEAFDLVIARQQWLHMPATLETLATVRVDVGDFETASRLLGAAERMRAERGPAAWPAQREENAQLGELLREALGESGHEQAQAEGAGLSQEELISWIRRARGSRKRPPGGWESLTPTELQVVRHLAEGLTNPQIGERMFISRATVKTHLSHIYAKLDVSSRVEVARMAAKVL